MIEKPSIEPEILPAERETMAINGIAFALVAVTGVSIAIAAEIARRQYHKAKREAAQTKAKE